jgi:muramidase (phage lysozyme)
MAADNLDDFNREIEELRRTMRLFGQDVDSSANSLKNFRQGASSSIGDLARATGNFVLTVGRGNTKFSSLNGVIDATTSTLGKLAQSIPVIGGIVKGITDGLGEASKFVIDQLDEVGDIFADFSKVGALTAENLDGLSQQFQLSGQSLQNFRKTIIENSVTFAQFGGIVSQGANTFLSSVGKLADPASTLGDSLRKLGLNTEDIVETGAAYARQQVLLGRNEFITQQSLTDGTRNLALEMDRLGKITGANRKQLQEQREAELREGIFGASIREMERAGQGELAKQIQNTSNILGSLVSPEVAQGFRDLMSGFPGTAEAQKLIQSTGGEAQRVLDDLRSGRTTDIDAVRRLSGSAKNFEIVVDQFARVGGEASGVYLRATDQTRLANLSIKDQTDLEKQLAAIREKQQGEQNKLTNNFVSANKELQVLNRQINLLSFQALGSAAVAVDAFASTVNNAVNYIAKKLGIELPAIQRTGAFRGSPAAGSMGPMGSATATVPEIQAARSQAGLPVLQGAALGAAERQQQAMQRARESGQPVLRSPTMERATLPSIAPEVEAGQPTLPASRAANVRDILNLIGRAESNNNADAVWPSTVIPGLSSMPVSEILSLQNQRLQQGIQSSAAGKYQITRGTLKDLIGQGVVGLGDIFNTTTQDEAALALLTRRGLYDYQRGNLTGNQFANNLAEEFAGLPGPNGSSMYGGLNRATVSRKEVIDVLGARYGGIMSGPTSGYRTTLHGTEAVIPLAGGRSIPVEMPGFNDNLRRLAEIMMTQNSRLDDLVDMMRVNNNLNKDMLRYQRA